MRGSVPLHSTVWDSELKGAELEASYWFENLRRPVLFAAAARAALAGDGPVVFVELSPHPLLQSALEDAVEESGTRGWVVSSLHRDAPEVETLLGALGRAFELGCAPAWERLYPAGGHTPLPAYPWQRRRFWPVRPATVAEAAPLAGLADAQVAGFADGLPYEIDGARGVRIGQLGADEAARVVAGLAARVLSVPGYDLAVDTPLPLLGLDSVLATRFRDTLRRDLGVEVPIRDLLGPATLRELAARLTLEPALPASADSGD
ncbi:MAG: acyltransferase domain-containing protein [Nonomuraea sp.]|nr:acyltransferase domain-containing protein [Nonomuraea sp.]